MKTEHASERRLTSDPTARGDHHPEALLYGAAAHKRWGRGAALNVARVLGEL